MKTITRLSLAVSALFLTSCALVAQPSYQRNSFTTNVQGNPIVGNAIVLTNAAEAKHWRFYGSDAETISRKSEVDSAQAAAISYTDGRFIEPILYGNVTTITNNNQTSLRFAPALSSASSIDFWQGVIGPFFRIVCVSDADRLRFYQGANLPFEIASTLQVHTNLTVDMKTATGEFGWTRQGRGCLHIQGNASTFSINGNYRTITNWTNFDMSRQIGGATNTGTLTLTNAGFYQVGASVCWDSNTGSGAFEGEVFTNGVASALEFHRDMPTGASAHGSASLQGIIYSSAGMTVNLRMKTGGTTETINVQSAQFLVVQLPD